MVKLLHIFPTGVFVFETFAFISTLALGAVFAFLIKMERDGRKDDDAGRNSRG